MLVTPRLDGDLLDIPVCMMDIRRPNQWLVAMVFFIIAYIAYVSLSSDILSIPSI